MKKNLKHMSAKHFFADYASGVRNFAHKMRGKDGNGNPIEFSDADKKLIAAGLKKMVADVAANLAGAPGSRRRSGSKCALLNPKPMNLFQDYTAELSMIDINNPDFKTTSNVHDWRNYVPCDWRNNWEQFTESERKIIAVITQRQADKEEWD